MIRHEKRANLLKRQLTTNSLNEQVVSWSSVGAIDLIISYRSGIVNQANDVMTTGYTITGLTNDIRPQEQDRIEYDGKTYRINSIIETGRRRMMALEEDRVIG